MDIEDNKSRCQLCNEISSETFGIFSEQGVHLNVASIIAKHFPFLQNITNDHTYEAICIFCWRVVQEFHTLYELAEKIWTTFSTTNIAAATATREPELNDIKIEIGQDNAIVTLVPTDCSDTTPEIMKNSSYKLESFDCDKETICDFMDHAEENLTETSDEPVAVVSIIKQGTVEKPREKKIVKKNQEPTEKEGADNWSLCDAMDKKVLEHFQLDCKYCLHSSITFLEFLAHAKQVHKKRGFVYCCGRRFGLRCQVLDHIEWHSNPECFKCTECNKALSTKDSLYKHMKIHGTPQRSHKCGQCSKSFLNLYLLNVHLRRKHFVDENRKFLCDICKTFYRSKATLLRHMNKTHKLESFDCDKETICDFMDHAEENQTETSDEPVAVVSIIKQGTGEKPKEKEIVKKKQDPTEKDGDAMDKKVLEYFQLDCKYCLHSSMTFLEFLAHAKQVHKKRAFVYCCGRRFGQRSLVLDHIEWHSNPECFKCTECNKALSTKDSFCKHMKIHGTPQRSHKCGQCSKSFLNLYLLNVHLRRKHFVDENRKFLCDICKTSYRSKATLLRHMNTTHKLESFDCDKETIVHSMNHAEDHLTETIDEPVAEPTEKDGAENMSHREKNEALDKRVLEYFRLDCKYCSHSSMTFFEFLAHSLQVHKKRGFVSCCGRRFGLRCHVLDHIAWHINPECFKCIECNKTYTTKDTLEKHMKYHGPRTHKCEQCAKAFSNINALNEHLRRSHQSQYLCDICKKFFSTKSSIRRHITDIHMRTSDENEICYICATTYRSKGSLKIHLMHKHEQDPALLRVQCNICGVWCGNEMYLRVHVSLRHIQKPVEIKCKYCDEVKTSNHSMHRHVWNVHKEGAHKCNVCDKSFTLSLHLREHMATHSGLDLYNCYYCAKTFKHKRTFYSHRKKAHPIEWNTDRIKRLNLA